MAAILFKCVCFFFLKLRSKDAGFPTLPTIFMSSRKEDLSEFDPRDYDEVPDEFPAVTDRFADLGVDSLTILSHQILREAYEFCNEFVPGQLAYIKRGITVANQRMERAKSADEYMKLAATAKTLYGSYAQLLEQSTVVFMSTYRPVLALIDAKSKHIGTSMDDANERNSNEAVTEPLDISGLEDEYKPYQDE
jgi:hypothetical protein